MRSTLYVSNVGHVADLCDIEELLSTVGDVTAQRLELIPESGQRLTFGIFEMSTEKQAFDCVERFNGHTINGRRLAIVLERPKTKPRPLAPPPKKGSRRVL